MINKEIIKSTYESKTAEENAANIKNNLAADACWTEAAGFPYAGTYIGWDEIEKNVLYRLATDWIDFKVTMEDYVAEGDKVMAYGKYTGTYKSTGNYFETRVAHLWKFKDGKIIRFEQFVDTQLINNAILTK